MNWKSLESLSRLGLGGAVLLSGIVSGCGDDEGSAGNTDGADASVSSAATSDSTPASSGAPVGTADSTDTDDGQTTVGESSDSTMGGATSGELPDSSPDAGDGEQTQPGATEGDASVSVDTDPTSETSASDSTSGAGPNVEDGGLANCGAEGELCCASAGGGFGGGGGGGTCDDGLQCNNPAGNGLTDSECVVAPTETSDAGEPACGAESELCCASGGGGFGGGGGGGTCDEGLQCNNPAGNGLTDSECVVAPTETSDAGEPACGTEGELCCASGGGGFGGGGGGGTCDEGLQCNNPAGNGLTDSECVTPAETSDAGL